MTMISVDNWRDVAVGLCLVSSGECAIIGFVPENSPGDVALGQLSDFPLNTEIVVIEGSTDAQATVGPKAAALSQSLPASDLWDQGRRRPPA